MKAERSIRRLGNLGRWDRRARWNRTRVRLTLSFENMKDKLESGQDRWRIARSLAAQIFVPFVLSLALFALVEGVALAGRRLGIEELSFWVTRVQDDTYESLAGAGVGAIATFLGLYYATVGVVASTVYGSVPPGIRTLFVREPSGVVYVRGVAYALVFGLLLLAAGAVGYRPSPASLAVFTLLAATSVLRLLILGGSIFNFFDPTALTLPLTKRFISAAKMASTTPASLNAASQMTAHARARAVLHLYGQLAMLLEDRRARDSSGPNRVTGQILRLISRYTTVKHRIPSESAWWGQVPSHPNWLTAGHLELTAALNTATGLQPRLVADTLWIETAAADVLQRTLSSAYEARGSAGALGFAKDIAKVINHLSSRLQVDEAMVLESVWSGALRNITAAQPVETDQLTGHQVAVNQLAAAEQAVMPMTEAWLGFIRAASRIVSQDLPSITRRALSSRSNLYSAPLPASTIKLLEGFAQKLDLEVATERRRITPLWWLSHFTARSIATHLKESHDVILQSVNSRVDPIIGHFSAESRHDLAAVAALSALELVHKIEVHQGVMKAAFDGLSRHRNDNTSVDYWPETPNDANEVVRMRATLNRGLSETLPHLRGSAFNEGSPDIYGQTYQVILEAVFVEILEGDSPLALDLFTSLFREVDHVRERLRTDVADHNLDIRIAYSAEPLMSLMELSGYACLMEHVNGTGIWSSIKLLWDGLLANGEAGEIARRYIVALEVSGNHLGFNPGTMGRSTRYQRVRQILSERGIRGGRRRQVKSSEHINPIISMFVPGDHGGHEEIADLFVAEYLVDNLPPGDPLPTRTRSVVNALKKQRDQEFRGQARSSNATSDPTFDTETSDEETPDA